MAGGRGSGTAAVQLLRRTGESDRRTRTGGQGDVRLGAPPACTGSLTSRRIRSGGIEAPDPSEPISSRQASASGFDAAAGASSGVGGLASGATCPAVPLAIGPGRILDPSAPVAGVVARRWGGAAGSADMSLRAPEGIEPCAPAEGARVLRRRGPGGVPSVRWSRGSWRSRRRRTRPRRPGRTRARSGRCSRRSTGRTGTSRRSRPSRTAGRSRRRRSRSSARRSARSRWAPRRRTTSTASRSGRRSCGDSSRGWRCPRPSRRRSSGSTSRRTRPPTTGCPTRPPARCSAGTFDALKTLRAEGVELFDKMHDGLDGDFGKGPGSYEKKAEYAYDRGLCGGGPNRRRWVEDPPPPPGPIASGTARQVAPVASPADPAGAAGPARCSRRRSAWFPIRRPGRRARAREAEELARGRGVPPGGCAGANHRRRRPGPVPSRLHPMGAASGCPDVATAVPRGARAVQQPFPCVRRGAGGRRDPAVAVLAPILRPADEAPLRSVEPVPAERDRRPCDRRRSRRRPRRKRRVLEVVGHDVAGVPVGVLLGGRT